MCIDICDGDDCCAMLCGALCALCCVGMCKDSHQQPQHSTVVVHQQQPGPLYQPGYQTPGYGGYPPQQPQQPYPMQQQQQYPGQYPPQPGMAYSHSHGAPIQVQPCPGPVYSSSQGYPMGAAPVMPGGPPPPYNPYQQ